MFFKHHDLRKLLLSEKEKPKTPGPLCFYPSFIKLFDLTSTYVSLYYHPGVGQTHVALCAEELETLLQIPLGVVINLRKQGRKNDFIRKENKII